MPGVLYVIATPIGNLEDASPRALRVLREARFIACEDTRRTQGLLARFGIEASLISCHEFNECLRIEPVLARLRGGEDVALVSDGGTPAISDPGSALVAAAAASGIAVIPVPGPSAVVTALSASGFPADRFVFDGFLPPRAGERRRRLRELRAEARTLVVFEAPHRILAALADIDEVFGARPLVLGREITKRFETFLRGSANEIRAQLERGEVKGEVVLVLAGAGEDEGSSGDDPSERIRAVWRAALKAAGGDRREALKAAARALALKRPELQRRLAEIGEERDGRA